MKARSGIMEKEYDYEAVEKFVESIQKELEPKVAKELCALLRIERPYDIRTINEVEEESDYGLGFCHVVWRAQKTVLKRDYNIEWKSPADLNPENCYD